MWEVATTAVQLIALGAVGVAALGWLLTSFRKGGDEAEDRIIKLRKEEIEALNERITRLSDDLSARNSELDVMRGAAEQRDKEIESLRALVMGKEVPPAMRHEMDLHHGQTRQYVHNEMRVFRQQLLEALLAMSNDFREALDEYFPKNGNGGSPKAGEPTT